MIVTIAYYSKPDDILHDFAGQLIRALKPCAPFAVKLLDRLAAEARQSASHREAALCLQIRQVAIAFGKLFEECGVERQAHRRVDRIEPVDLVDRLSSHDRPAPAALLEKIVEAADACDVDGDAVDERTLFDRHARLRDGAIAG